MGQINEYKIYNINWGLFGNDIIIKAKSPREAVKKAGYKAVRDYEGKGNIVVRNWRGSYVFKEIR